MYKVKDNTFRVRDFTSGDNVDMSKFVEGTNQRGAPQMQAQVCVLYKDEYNDIKTKLDSHESEVQHLKDMIEERESQIMKLKKEIKDNEGANIDEVMQLKEDNYNMTQDHQRALEDLKEKHANQMRAIDETHKKEIRNLEEQYNAKLDEVNDKLLSQVQANEQVSNNLRDEMLTMSKAHTSEIDKLHQENTRLEKARLEDLKTKDNEHANEILELEKAHHLEVSQLKEDNSQLKQDHLKEINKLDKAHNDEREQIRTSFLNLITNVNAQDLTEIDEIQKEVPSIFKPFMRKHMRKLEELKERKQANTPEKIVKTYELSGAKEQ